jgi:four helix bundle protein
VENELCQRLFNFAVNVIKYCRTLKKSKENDIIIYQLIKSSTSSPANYEESQAASSRADFRNKVLIALREMRESNFWLRVLNAVGNESKELNILLSESIELKKILGSISAKVVKTNTLFTLIIILFT